MAQQPINYGAFSGNALGSYFNTVKGFQEIERGGIQNQSLQQQVNQSQQSVSRKEQARSQAQEIFKSKSPEQISDFLIENPEYSKIFDAAGEYASPISKQSKLDTARNISLGSNVQEELQKSLRVIQQEGGDPTDTLKMLEQQPENIKDIAESIWASMDPVGHKEFRLSNPIGGEDDSSLPAETRAFNDLIKDFSPKEQSNAKRIKAGLKGRAMNSSLMTAIEQGKVSNIAEAKAEIKKAEKFAEMTATSRAKTIDKGFESIQKIDQGLVNIDDAISAVDADAGVGAFEKLWPSVKSASVELDNIRGRMALDVVGATTFGALSKGELDLAKDIALPTGLNTAELKDYLIRKRAAQVKLRDYYNEQIQFLDQGGSVAQFLRKKEREKSEPEAKTINWGDM